MIAPEPQSTPEPWSKRGSLTPRRTYSKNSRVIYKRRVRSFKPSDLARIADKVQLRTTKGDSFKNTEDFPIFTRILNWAAEAMLSRILGVIGLDSEASELLWSAINDLWLKFVMEVDPTRYGYRIQIAYKEKMERALREYTRNGKYDLLDALLRDLVGAKK